MKLNSGACVDWATCCMPFNFGSLERGSTHTTKRPYFAHPRISCGRGFSQSSLPVRPCPRFFCFILNPVVKSGLLTPFYAARMAVSRAGFASCLAASGSMLPARACQPPTLLTSCRFHNPKDPSRGPLSGTVTPISPNASLPGSPPVLFPFGSTNATLRWSMAAPFQPNTFSSSFTLEVRLHYL